MTDYQKIEKAIAYVKAHVLDQPNLKTLAREIGLSMFHFHRLFTRWAGVTPKDFLQYCTAVHAKERLRDSQPLLQTAHESGLSGPGRLHDLILTLEGVTPGQYKRKGEGVKFNYGFHSTPFGPCLIGITRRGICYFDFLIGTGKRAERIALGDLKKTWPNALFQKGSRETGLVVTRIFSREKKRATNSVSVFAIGTPFQLKVWEAALKIPEGQVLSYEQVARLAGAPRAARAVGSALSRNPICYLIPCHRVIRQTGIIGRYRGGERRKQALLAWEFSKTASPSFPLKPKST